VSSSARKGGKKDNWTACQDLSYHPTPFFPLTDHQLQIQPVIDRVYEPMAYPQLPSPGCASCQRLRHRVWGISPLAK
jgi:hypothetical protein